MSIIFLIAVNILLLFVSGSSRKEGDYSYSIKHIAITLVSPFQEVAANIILSVKNIWKHYFFLVSVAEKNDLLQKELRFFIEKENRCKEIAASNQRLRSFLKFRKIPDIQLLPAEVIGKDPSPWFKSIIIDKGKAEGMKKGLPVVIPEGIAGLITDVSNHHSKILLIVDRNCAIDALSQGTRARGMIKGNGFNQCFFKYVLRKHDIKTGDIIVSSGLDSVFPKGFRIGEVSDISQKNSDAIFQEITVTPYVDFEKLEEVFVVLNPPNESVNSEQLSVNSEK